MCATWTMEKSKYSFLQFTNMQPNLPLLRFISSISKRLPVLSGYIVREDLIFGSDKFHTELQREFSDSQLVSYVSSVVQGISSVASCLDKIPSPDPGAQQFSGRRRRGGRRQQIWLSADTRGNAFSQLFLFQYMSQADLLFLLHSSLSTSSSLPSAVPITREELLLELEKCDKNLPYIKNLQKRIKVIVNQLLETELSSNGIWDLLLSQVAVINQSDIPSLVEKIMSSSQYHSLLQGEINQAKQTVAESISQHPTESFETINLHQEIGAASRLRQHSASFSNTSNANSESSYGSFSLHIPPGYEDVKSVASSFTSGIGDMETRLAAIGKFSALSTSDLTSPDLWNTTNKVLYAALKNEENEICLISLRLIARIFRSAPPSV